MPEKKTKSEAKKTSKSSSKTVKKTKAVKNSTKTSKAVKKTVKKTEEKKSKTLTSPIKQKKEELMHKMFSGKYFYANGKRKTAVARVRVYEKGKGEIIVNGKSYEKHLKTGSFFGLVKSPLKLIGISDFSITAKIQGGGLSAQADALRHGIAKAIALMDEGYRLTLKKAGQITRDARKVERKKPGRRKARRAQQWVKR